MNNLQGRKTYIAATLGGVSTIAYLLGYITPEQLNVLIGLLGFSGMAAIRAAIK